MTDTVRTQAELLAFLHPNIPNPQPDSTVLVAQAARDLIVSIPTLFGTIGSGVDGFGYPPARYLEVLNGSAAQPTSMERPTVKFQQAQMIPAPVHNPLDAGYTATLLALLESQPGNKVQPTAIYADAQGYADGFNYLIGVEGEGTQLTGSGGGGMGGYFLGNTYVIGGSAVGINPGAANISGADDISASAIVDAFAGSAQGKGTVTISSTNPGVVTRAGHLLSANTAVVFTTTGALPTNIVAGSIYYVISAGLTANSFRISATEGGAAIDTTAGVQSGVHSLTSYNLVGAGLIIRTDTVKGIFTGIRFSGRFEDSGIDMSGAHVVGDFLRMDPQFRLGIIDSTNVPFMNWDTLDYIQYARSLNTWSFIVNNVAMLQVVGGTPGANATTLWITEGTGPTTRQVKWVDPGAAGVNLTAGQRVMVLV